jgi:hypothetical protein
LIRQKALGEGFKEDNNLRLKKTGSSLFCVVTHDISGLSMLRVGHLVETASIRN